MLHDRHLKSRCTYRENVCKCICPKKGIIKHEDGTESEEPDTLTKFFAGKWNNVIFKGRYVIVALLGVLGLTAAVIGMQIGPLTEQEKLLPPDHPSMIVQELLEANFTSTTAAKEALVVRFNWGVAGLNRDNVGAWDPDDLGELIWDDTFNIYPPEN